MTYTLGLIGFPVAHSLSPRIHTAALHALGLQGAYTALLVPPADLETALHTLLAAGYTGLNVTIPHKQAIMRLVDGLSDDARAIGAVNTILVERGRLIGHNTDGGGFRQGLANAGVEMRGQSALVLGAGGAARAVVYSLQRTGAIVTVWNRTAHRAQELAHEFGVQAVGGPAAELAGDWDLLINTTSVGMVPNRDAAPVRLAAGKLAARCVYDLVYNPRETVLLAQARAQGAQVIDGMTMLVYQAAEAFRLWTGCEPPVDAMRRAAEAGA